MKISAMPIYTIVPTGGQEIISPPKSINDGTQSRQGAMLYLNIK